MKTDKIRDMVRSILPSKRRRSARFEKAQAVRQNRRQVRQACHDALIEYYDDKEFENRNSPEFKLFVSDFEKKIETRNAVRDRRGADKINHFVRWAKDLTKNFKEEDVKGKYYAVASKIGGNKDVIREHALGHFIGPWEFNPVYRTTWRSTYAPAPILIPSNVFAKLFRDAFELDHKGLNKILKRVRFNCYDKELPCHSQVKINKEHFVYDHIIKNEDGTVKYKYKVTLPFEKKDNSDYVFHHKYSTTVIEDLHDETKCEKSAWIKGPQDVEKIIKLLIARPITKWDLTSQYHEGYNILEILHFFKEKNLLNIELPPKRKTKTLYD